MMSVAYDYDRETRSPIASDKPKLLLIDGQRMPSASGRTFQTLNPATEQVIATIAEGDKADLATPLPQRAAPSGRCARRKSIASALLIAAAVDRSTAMVPRP
jgi:acyl-CoA reductase-like NAD-dependent aldehyde dehydrogenase